MEIMASYVLIGACAILILFSLILVLAMLSYDEKASKTAKRLEKHEIHLQCIDKLQDVQSSKLNQLSRRVQELERKSISGSTGRVNLPPRFMKNIA